MLNRGDVETARGILRNYAGCVGAPTLAAKQKASTGLTELTDVYSRADHSLLKTTLHDLGTQLRGEGNADLQSLLGASFVRFSHESAARRHYPAVHEALVAMETLQQDQPEMARILWPRVKVGNSLSEFIEEEMHVPRIPEGLIEVLQRMPHAPPVSLRK